MNITFIANKSCSPVPLPEGWRGNFFYRSLKKNGIHSSTFTCYEELEKKEALNQLILDSTQIFILEASPKNGFLEIINFIKSKEKKVIVDIPLATDILELSETQPGSLKHVSSQLFTGQQNTYNRPLDVMTYFRWGLNLADCILITSDFQIKKWQCHPPVIKIPELIDLMPLEIVNTPNSDTLQIGIFQTGNEKDKALLNVIEKIEKNCGKIKANYFPLQNTAISNNNGNDSIRSHQQTIDHSTLLSVDLGVFWDCLPVRGLLFRNALEFMYKKKPVLFNSSKGYHDIAKYGVIIEENTNWENDIIYLKNNLTDNSPKIENGYLFAIGRNIDDYINEFIRILSEIIRLS